MQHNGCRLWVGVACLWAAMGDEAFAQEVGSSTTGAMAMTSTNAVTSSAAQPPPVLAVEPPPAPPINEPPPASEQRAEELVVTGSRIRTLLLETPAPITTLSHEDLKQTGLTSVGDILQRLPVSGGALNTKFNSSGNFGFPPDGDGIGAGAAQADLRYLGSKRVLVLVDGVRWVNGSSASGVSAATDLNTIPVAMIDRIEILQDGASAIYGSDAIAGVINIITRTNFEGIDAGVYVGGYHHGDGITQQYDATWGTKSERLSLVLSLSFVRQDPVWSGDRDLSRFPIPNFEECTAACSSGTPQGRFVFTDPNTMQDVDLTINDNVGGIPVYDPSNPGGGGDFHEFGLSDRFNFSPFNYVLTPSNRFGSFSKLEYKIVENVKFNAKVLYSYRNSRNQAAPEPLFIGPEAGNGNRLDTISIDATNPYNPFGFTLDAETNPYFIGRRPLEAGPRNFRQTVNTWYVSGGFSGRLDLGDRSIFWDATTAYSKNRADQIKTGGFNSAKLQKALGPLADCEADPDCVPFNIFGGQGADGTGSITPEMLDYVGFVAKDVSEQEFFDVQANLSTSLFQLPAGGLGIAAGIEYRRLAGFYQPDSVIVAGESSDVPSSPTDGRYNAIEGYGEVSVPILADLPGIEYLDISGAIRVSNYSTFGTEETFKVGGRYRPFEDLLLRGSWGQGFRAPGIGELFGTEARFDQTLADPCSDFDGRNGEPASQDVKDNCIALGVPANGDYEQFNAQISVATGGNRELRPETSKGYTLSLVYSPSQLEDNDYVEQLEFEIGYYRVDLDGAIRALDAQIQLDRCARTLDPVLCAGISRTPTGVINRFENKLTNIGGITTNGVDFVISYLSPSSENSGYFRLTSLSNVLISYTERIPNDEGFEEVKRAGTEVGDPQQAYPRFKSTLILEWGLSEWAVQLSGRYIHSVTEDCRGLTDFPDTCSDFDEVDDMLSKNTLTPRVYVDAQVTWSPTALDERLGITLGVNNLLNQDPPACYSCALNGFDGSTYDVPGVFGYVRAGYRFAD